MTKHQNKIEKLIIELCPNGVEFKELGEVCEFKYGKGNTIPKVGGEYPVYGCNGIVGNHHEFNNEDSPIIGHIGTAGIVVWGKGKHFVTYNGTICKPKDKTLFSKYVYYNLLILNLSNLTQGSQPFLSYGTIKAIKIPIPPLSIQKEIVKILDNFTELEAELEARKKQYEYYRDKLLTSEDEIKWFTLAELTKSTENIKWKESDGVYQYIDLSSVDRNLNTITETAEITFENAPSRAQKIVQKNDIIFATTRPTLRRYTIIDDDYDGQVASTGYCVLRASDKVLPKWIYYNIAKTEFNNYVEKNQKGASYPAISDAEVKNFKIPVPSIEEQKRIVSILDKFDALVNDISIGLPAELTARRSQYEYYRGKLLTFKEKEYAK